MGCFEKSIKATICLPGFIPSKVMPSESRRDLIVRLHLQGTRPSQIVSLLNEARSTVNATIKRYQQTGSIKDRKRSGRPCTARTAVNRQAVRSRVQRSNQWSTRKLANAIGISRRSVQRLLKNDLGTKPYKMQKAQLLTDKAKNTRVKRSRALLRRFAAGRHRRILFSDEKLFCTEIAHNHHNDRIWAAEPPAQNGIVERSQKPKSLMVWAGITADGKTPLVFLDSGTKINQEVYQTSILNKVLLPWTQQHFRRCHWTFQQDSAPSHTAKTTQHWIRTHFPEFITPCQWPPYSPDLNPLDCSIWSILEQKACKMQHNSIRSLNRALKKAWGEISLETINKIVDDFPKRLRQCIEANGGHFEL